MKSLRECSSLLTKRKKYDKKVLPRCFASDVIRKKSSHVLITFDETRKMPENHGLPFLGTLSWLISSGGGTKIHEYVDQKHKELGPVYRDCVGPVKAVFINSPDEYRRIFRLEGPTPKHYLPETWHLYNEIRSCRRGLLFMDGEEWLHFRRIMNKIMLAPDPVGLMSTSCQNAADFLVERWRIYSNKKMIVPDIDRQLYQWSIDVMLAILTGPSLWNEYKKNFQQQSKILSEILHHIFVYSVRLSILPAKLSMRMKIPWWTKFVKCIDDTMAILRALIPEMVRLKGDGLLQLMMAEGIHDEDLKRIVIDLIIAAGDTTAYSMEWSLFLLASHPKVQEKLYENIKDLDQKNTLQNSFLRGVIKESLRLYPTAPFLTRYLPEDNTIAGYRVSKEELLLLSLYSSGRDPANFVRPDEFRPERWIRTEKSDYEGVITPHAMLPFAMGARSCVGRKLAETQLSLTIAKLVKNFKMQCENKDRVKMILHMISVPSEPIQLKLTAWQSK